MWKMMASMFAPMGARLVPHMLGLPPSRTLSPFWPHLASGETERAVLGLVRAVGPGNNCEAGKASLSSCFSISSPTPLPLKTLCDPSEVLLFGMSVSLSVE